MRISAESQGSLRTLPTFIPFFALKPLHPAAYLHGRFLFFDVDANRETSHEIPSIILVHALALWSRYESSRERSELFGFGIYVFLNRRFCILYPYIIPDHLHDLSKYRVGRNLGNPTEFLQ